MGASHYALSLSLLMASLVAGCVSGSTTAPAIGGSDPSIEVLARYAVEDFGERGAGPSNVSLQTLHFPPGAQTTIHRHYGPEFHYFQEGEFSLLTEQGTLHFRAGDSYVVPPGVIHRMRNEGRTQGRVLNVSVVPEGRPTSEAMERELPE
jgi:mannose-6-phosphate isomerase-like protein (cupin superfamily)